MTDNDRQETARGMMRAAYADMHRFFRAARTADSMTARALWLSRVARQAEHINSMTDIFINLDVLPLDEIEQMEDAYHV